MSTSTEPTNAENAPAGESSAGQLLEKLVDFEPTTFPVLSVYFEHAARSASAHARPEALPGTGIQVPGAHLAGGNSRRVGHRARYRIRQGGSAGGRPSPE